LGEQHWATTKGHSSVLARDENCKRCFGIFNAALSIHKHPIKTFEQFNLTIAAIIIIILSSESRPYSHNRE